MAASAKGELKSFVERIERLESDKAEIASDIRDVYKEAASKDYDCKALRKIVKMRMTKDGVSKYNEQMAVVEIYLAGLGMLATTPLGESALKHEIGEAFRAAGILST